MNIEPTTKQVNLAAKNPLAYMLIVALILLGIVATAYFNSNDGRNGDCTAQNQVLMKRIERLEGINDVLTLRLVEQGEMMTSLKNNTDSLIRATIGRKAKQLSLKSR